MMSNQPNDHLWSIILAGGEEEQISPFIEQWLGHSMPKQFCTFVGTRSMLQHTIDRADCLSPREHKVIVVDEIHRHLLIPYFKKHRAGQVVLQPKSCKTGAGVFLPLTFVLARDSNATVIIYPPDHFVFPEERFVETIQQAIKIVELMTDRIILLGAQPTHLEFENQWLERGEIIGCSTGARLHKVKDFIEILDPIQGLRALASRALWNTSVIAAKATTLWHLGWNCFPELMDRFAQLRGEIGTPRENQILQAIYGEFPHRNFSSDFLQRVLDRVSVLELEGVLWSDWRSPERIVETLRLIGKEPAFPKDLVNNGIGSGWSRSQIEVG